MSNEAAERLRDEFMGVDVYGAEKWNKLLGKALAAERKATVENLADAILNDYETGFPIYGYMVRDEDEVVAALQLAILDAEAAK